VIRKHIVDPYYEAKGEKNPEARELFDKDGNLKSESGEKPNIFTDLGGKETPINRKNVKISGKAIK
jgi:hypothetical protein